MIDQLQVNAKVMQFSSSLALSRAVIDSVKLYEHQDIGLDQLVYSITIELLGNKTKTEEYDDVVKVYPSTIWEELKSLWPRWLRRRFPVRYTRDILHRTVKHYHICPHLDWPNNAKHMEWLIPQVDRV